MTLDDRNLTGEELPENAAAPLTLDTLEDAEPAAPEAPEEITEISAEPTAEPLPESMPEPVSAPDPQPLSYTSPETPAPVAAPPAKKAPKAKRRKPHIALRIPLQLLSFVLTFVLFAVILCGALLADLRQITSEGGIKQIVNALLVPTANAPVTVHPAPIEADLMNTDAEAPADGTTPEGTLPGGIIVDGDNITIGGDISIDIGDIPDDILTGGGGEANVLNLADYVYDLIDASIDNSLPFSKSEFQEFVQESTFSDYISEKLAGFADDFINNTENTRITSREILKLLEDNEALMKSELNMELTAQQWDEIEKTVEQIVEENNINETVRDKVYEAVDNVLEESPGILGDMHREDLQEFLQLLTSDKLFWGFVGAAAVLLLLLCLLNFYNVPAALTWASFPTMIAGAILSIPVLALQTASDVVMDLIPSVKPLIGVLTSFIGVFAPIHYGVLITGVGLLVVSIIWRIIRAVVRKHRVTV